MKNNVVNDEYLSFSLMNNQARRETENKKTQHYVQ